MEKIHIKIHSFPNKINCSFLKYIYFLFRYKIDKSNFVANIYVSRPWLVFVYVWVCSFIENYAQEPMKLSLSRLMYNIYLAASVKLVICLGRSTSEFKSVSHDSFQIFLCFFPFFRSLSFCNIYSFFQFHFEWIGLCGFRFVAKVFEFRIGSQWLYGSRFCEYRLITHKISKLIAKK